MTAKLEINEIFRDLRVAETVGQKLELGWLEIDQRHTLFHTKGVVQERSIRIIIDSGSCNNLASTVLVEKLSLTTRKHPNPYHIQWLNDGGKLE